MNVEIRTKRHGDHASLVVAGPFDLAHATAMSQAAVNAEAEVRGCGSIELNLSQLDRIDGAGAVVLARFLERLGATGARAHLGEGQNPEAERLISLYRERRSDRPPRTSRLNPLERIGALVPQLADKAYTAFDSIGCDVAALPKVAAAPSTVDWGSLPRLIQQIGADALLVTSAANLLVGVIIGFLGVSQLGRFGAVAFVPQLVVVAHFRELGPLVTAIVVAGRSSAGLASEIATMKVSEEIDALRSIGFDPVRWLVVPRCLALALTLPLLTWVGYVWALVGGLAATTITTDMTAYLYTQATLDAITAGDLFAGLVKTPFLAVAIGLIACSEGLLTRGGAAAVGVRTTSAVVLSIFSVIVISAIFTFFFTLLGI
jgi:phospholipid/cholesterol/gamma-HCH transport system permease protein